MVCYVQIRAAFEAHGEVVDVYIPQRAGGGQGIAFVRFGSWAAAEQAIKTMNGQEACGSTEPIVVRFADAKKRDRSSGGDGNDRPFKRPMGGMGWMGPG